MGRRRRHLFERRRRNIDPLTVFIVVASAIVVWYAAKWFWDATRVDIAIEGLVAEAIMDAETADALAVRIRVDPVESLDKARLTLDGEDVTEDAERFDDGFWYAVEPGALSEGEHRLSISVPRILLARSSSSWSFTVDATPPEFDVRTVLDPVPIDSPVTVRGRVDPTAQLTVDGAPLDTDDGEFELSWDLPPTGPVDLEAVDKAGNRSATEIIVPVQHPYGDEPRRAVHMTAASWNYDPMREGVLRLIDEGRINTVELDIKDEGGVVGHTSSVPLARQTGATKDMYDLKEVVEEIEERGADVIGRVVVFRDPLLSAWALQNGKDDWLFQTADRRPHSAYGGFTNIASPEVWEYNVDLAVEATEAGIEDILYDYIRRPEGDIATMHIPGLGSQRPHDAVVDFLSYSYDTLRPLGVVQGASVFGIAASRPDPVAQDIPLIARYSDYVSPMVYPSLWVKGEYRVPDPVRMPYDIIKKSLADFQEQMAGTGKPIVPWLQDFSLGHPYGPAEVQAQIDGAASLGIDSFLLWDPLVSYTVDGLQPIYDPRREPIGETTD